MTGKKVYRAITRGLFNFTDREGGGRRLVNDAPVLIDLIRKNPAVRDAAIVAFADRRTGVGLYAFVEADQTALEAQLRNELTAAKGPKPPEHIQVVQALPRDAAGKPRTEILQLVAMNQLDLIEPMMTSDDRPRVPEEHPGVSARICATGSISRRRIWRQRRLTPTDVVTAKR